MMESSLWLHESVLTNIHQQLKECMRSIASFENCGELSEGYKASLEHHKKRREYLLTELDNSRKAYAKALIAAYPQILD